MIPERGGLLAEIKRLEATKKLREQEIEKFLYQTRELRREIETLDARIRSQWAVYNKFYREELGR